MHKASYATTFYFRLIPLKNKFSVDFPSSPVPADHAVQAGKVLCISGHQIGKFRVVVHPSLVMCILSQLYQYPPNDFFTYLSWSALFERRNTSFSEIKFPEMSLPGFVKEKIPTYS